MSSNVRVFFTRNNIVGKKQEEEEEKHATQTPSDRPDRTALFLSAPPKTKTAKSGHLRVR